MDFYTNVKILGENVLLRGVKNGERYAKKTTFKPEYFVISNNPERKHDFRTLDGQKLERISFSTIREAKEFKNNYKEIENFPIYGDLRFDHSFISHYFNQDVLWDKKSVCIAFLDIEVDSSNGFPDPKRADQKITAITVSIGDNYYVFGMGSYTPSNNKIHYKKCENEAQLLREFINVWTLYYPDILSGWNVEFFDVPYLINRIKKIFGEDKLVEKELSPWRKIHENEVKTLNGIQQSYEIVGVSLLDYYDIYKKYSGRSVQESYKLDYICSVELGEKKLDYSEYGSLHKLYTADYEKFISYNIRDVELVYRLEEKLKLIELVMTLAYESKVNYIDVLSQVKMWDAIIYNTLKKKKIAIPPKRFNNKDNQYEGAYVKDPQLGMHNWVASFDLTSLYPMLIQQYNISPETKVSINQIYSELDGPQYSHLNKEEKEELKELLDYLSGFSSSDILQSVLNKKIKTSVLKKCNLTFTPNAQLFSTISQGFLSEVMEKMYDGRAEFKNKMLEAKRKLEKEKDNIQRESLEREIARCNNIQLAKKVTLNSAYGAIGSSYFRFFDVSVAEAITLSGQLSIKWIENKLNRYLNGLLKTNNKDYVIASDTDSIILNLAPIVNKFFEDQSDKRKIIRFLDKVCQTELNDMISQSYDELADYVNAYSQKMTMKREALADKAIWTAKKKYMMHVYNNENVEYEEPQLKIMGMEAIKSSTPNICRQKFKQALKIIATKTEEDLIKFVQEFQSEFQKLKPEDVAFPRGAKDISKYKDSKTIFAKATPMHVKGCLLYNDRVAQLGLQNKFDTIKNGDKIKYLYLREPNILRSHVISFPEILPEEFDLHQYIDYDTQYEKAFLDPLKLVLNSIGWDYERKNNLSAFFA